MAILITSVVRWLLVLVLLSLTLLLLVLKLLFSLVTILILRLVMSLAFLSLPLAFPMPLVLLVMFLLALFVDNFLIFIIMSNSDSLSNWSKIVKFIIELLKLILSAFLGASGANLLG